MTKEENEKLERQKEWVEHRRNCTMRAVFDHLVSAVQYDVKAFNVPFEKTDNEGDMERFKVEDTTGGDPGIMVTEVVPYGDPNYVKIELKKLCISVRNRDGKLFTITPHWNEDDLECKLLIDGNPESYTYPQISQKAIGGLLFKGPTYPPAMEQG